MMKQIKMKIAVLLAFAIAISGISVGVNRADAENVMTVYGEAVTATAGKEIKVPVMVKDNHGVAGLALKVTYDAAVMTPVKAEKGSLLSGLSNLQFGDTIANHAENSFECVAYNDSNFTDNGELFVLTFQMADGVSAGTYSLKLELTEHYNEALADIEVGCEDITVTVGGASPTGTQNATAKPATPTTKPANTNSFDVFITYIAKDAKDALDSAVIYDEDNSIKVSRNGSHKISYKAKKTAKDILALTLETKLDTLADGFSITPKTLTVGKTSYPLGKCDYTRNINTNYCGINIRNPYMKSDGNTPINQALGSKVIPVKSGDVIAVEFDVEGIEKLDMSKNPDASLVKKTTASPTNKPSGSSSTSTKTKKHTLVKKPGKVKIKKVKKSGKGRAKVTWGKVKCNDGYQIQYSRKKNFSGKQKTISYGKSTYIYGKSKKTYYVRVRAVNWGYTSQKKHGYKYGSWSKAKKVKLK